MPKLDRYIQKIFASTAQSSDIRQFGSLAEGSPQEASNLDEIQSRPTFLKGWVDAVLSFFSPALEDRNALDHLLTYQLAYLMEQGVAEWHTDQVYFVNSLAKGSDGVIYRSLADDNDGNDPVSDEVNWERANPSPIRNNAKYKNYLQDFDVTFTESKKTPTNFYRNCLSSAQGGKAVLMALPDEFNILYGKGNMFNSIASASMTCCASSDRVNSSGDWSTLAGRYITTNGPIYHYIETADYVDATTVASSITAPTGGCNIEKVIFANGYYIGVCSATGRVLVVNEDNLGTGTFDVVQFNSENISWLDVAYDNVSGNFIISGFYFDGANWQPAIAYSNDNGSNWSDATFLGPANISGNFHSVSLHKCNDKVFVYMDRQTLGNSAVLESSDGGVNFTLESTYLFTGSDPDLYPRYSVELPDKSCLIFSDSYKTGVITKDFITQEPFLFNGSPLPVSDFSTLAGPMSACYTEYYDKIVALNGTGIILSLGD